MTPENQNASEAFATALWAPFDALADHMDEEQLAYAASKMGNGFDLAVLGINMAWMAIDTAAGRTSHAIVVVLACWALLVSMLGDRVRQRRPDLDPKHRYAPDHGKEEGDADDADQG